MAALMTSSMLFAADRPVEGPIKALLGEAKFQIQQVFEGGRLPNVVVATDGTVLATHGATGGKGDWWDKGVQVRRSEDGGKTWGEPITIANPGWQGGGITVDETTGDILAFVENKYVGNDPDGTQLTIYRSTDHGKTWNAQKTVIHPDKNGNVPSMSMAEHGITLRHGKHKGRLLRPARDYAGGDTKPNWPKMYNTAIYSDDGGKTWHTSDPFPALGTGEGAVAELSDGRIYYNSRRHSDPKGVNPSMRWEAWSDDGGAVWKDLAISKVLPDGSLKNHGGCICGLVRLPVRGRDIILYSNCDSATRERRDVTVWASFDGAKTWPIKRRIFAGPSAYSSLSAGRPGTPSEGWIYILLEGSGKHRYAGAQLARLNLSWLLEGEETGDGELPKWLGVVPKKTALDTASVDIEFTAPLRLKTLGDTLPLNSNRRYTLGSVPKQLKNLKYTQHEHDNPATLIVTAQSDGDLYLCLSGRTPESLKLKGKWTPVATVHLHIDVTYKFTFYRSALRKGERLEIQSDPQWGSIVIAKQMRLKQPVGETLYNGIELPDQWPPSYDRNPREPMPVPYLQSPPAVIPIDIGRQLFVDDYLISETTLIREFHQPEYHKANPILKPEKPWENKSIGWFAAPFSGGAWYDPTDKLFKMWYTGGFLASTCYATSKDGIHWKRPKLGIEGETNIVLEPVKKGRRRVDTTTVWLDHNATDQKARFKYFATEAGGGWGMTYRASADGVHWSEPLAKRHIGGDRTTVFYNPFRKVWVLSERIGWGGRARAYSEDADPQKLIATKCKTVKWVAADELDPKHTVKKLARGPELYNVDAAPYESLMIGYFSIWQGPSNGECGRMKLQKRNDILLGFSRDGFHWDRPDRRRFISSTWDKDNWRFGNVQSVGGGCLVVGDKLYFYFSGRAKPDSGKWNTGKDKSSGGWDADAATGLAILRRDGFASMDASEEGGTLTTRPLTFKGRHLFVNVDCPGGELKAEVLDANGKVIEPFTLANCKPVSCDKTLAAVTWKNGDLSDVSGKPVRLRFHMKNGRVYSFWVSPDTSGASHGYVGAGGPGFTGATDTVGQSDAD